MIVETMTFEEVFHLLKEDLLQFNTIFQYKYDEVKKKTKNFKNRERIWHVPREFKTKNGFNFTIQFFSEPISVPEKERLRFLYYCWFKIRGKLYFYSLSFLNRSIGKLNVYTSHFVDRYNERCLGNSNISKLEAFRKYVQNNLKGATVSVPTEDYPDGFYRIGNDGIVLGEMKRSAELNCHVSFCNTFISWNLLGQDQCQKAMEGKLLLQSLGEHLEVPEDDFLPLFGNSKNGKFIKTERMTDSIELMKQMGADKPMSADRISGIL